MEITLQFCVACKVESRKWIRCWTLYHRRGGTINTPDTPFCRGPIRYGASVVWLAALWDSHSACYKLEICSSAELFTSCFGVSAAKGETHKRRVPLLMSSYITLIHPNSKRVVRTTIYKKGHFVGGNTKGSGRLWTGIVINFDDNVGNSDSLRHVSLVTKAFPFGRSLRYEIAQCKITQVEICRVVSVYVKINCCCNCLGVLCRRETLPLTLREEHIEDVSKQKWEALEFVSTKYYDSSLTSRRMTCAGHVSWTGEMRNACNVLVWRLEEKIPFGRLQYWSKMTLKSIIKNRVWRCGFIYSDFNVQLRPRTTQ
jgi:hypothetical protein